MGLTYIRKQRDEQVSLNGRYREVIVYEGEPPEDVDINGRHPSLIRGYSSEQRSVFWYFVLPVRMYIKATYVKTWTKPTPFRCVIRLGAVLPALHQLLAVQARVLVSDDEIEGARLEHLQRHSGFVHQFMKTAWSGQLLERTALWGPALDYQNFRRLGQGPQCTSETVFEMLHT